MTPIDLFDFTHNNKKIPSRLLRHKSPEAKETSSYQIIAAFFLDAFLIAGITTLAAEITSITTSTMMMGPALKGAFGKIGFMSFVTTLLPLIMTSYFFASFFFNQGQTYGMFKMKTRIDMPEMNFRSSLFWALYSAGAIMSAGLSLVSYQWLQNQGWGSFKTHDHLYFNLIAERSFSPINLITETERFNELADQNQVEENFYKAA